MIRDNGINYMESLSSIELNNIFNNKYRGNTPLVLYANGGSWDKLSMRERYNYIHNNYDILANGGTLDDIKRRFTEDENIAVPADENIFSSGGSIHIKPENRGKFTALKKRTGHSASWFKAHGTPAQRKMATFALNARKWKHGGGGNLFLNGGEEDNTRKTRLDDNGIYHLPWNIEDSPTVYDEPPTDMEIREANPFKAVPFYSRVNNLVELNPLLKELSGTDSSNVPFEKKRDFSLGANYIRDYYYSPGFDWRLNNARLLSQDDFRTERGTFRGLPAKPDFELIADYESAKQYPGAFYNGPINGKHSIATGSDEIPNNWEDAGAHEATHAIDNILQYAVKGLRSTNGAWSGAFPVFERNKIKNVLNSDLLTPKEFIDLRHKALPSESYAKLGEFRDALYRLGIFDSREPGLFTKEHLDAFRKAGGVSELLSEFSDEDIIWMMNYVAQNDGNLQDTSENNISALGGPIVNLANKHLYDGESEETLRLNNTSGFYNYDRDKGVIQLPWNTPLRQRMADRREAEIIDLRLNRPTFTDWIKELPASFISDFTASDDYVPEILKTDRMKYIDHLNSKYNLLGEKRIRYSDAPNAQRERGRRPWTKEVGFDKKFDIGGKLFYDGGTQESDNTRINLGIVPNLPMDNSLDSTIKRIDAFNNAVTDEERYALPYPTDITPLNKFYMDLALMNAKDEAERQEILRRYYNTPTIGPTNIAALTGHIQVDPKTGDVVGYKAPTVKVNNLPGAWQQMAERAWESPAFQLALAPMLDAPFILGNIAKERNVLRNIRQAFPDNSEELLYRNYINGYSPEKLLGVDNNIFNSLVTKGVLPEVKDNIMHNVVERNLMEYMPAIPIEDLDFAANGYRTFANKLLDDVHVGRYSGDDYTKAGEWAGGFYIDDADRPFISVNRNTSSILGPLGIEEHEARHLIDYKGLTVSPQQEHILDLAYGDDFINLPNTPQGEGFKDYTLMNKEKITTNADSRNVLLYTEDGKLLNAPIEVQNNYIDNSPDIAIFQAVEQSNGYGQAYIEYLRKNNLLTPEKALTFRESMKRVGDYIPWTIGGAAGYSYLNQDELPIVAFANGGNLFDNGGYSNISFVPHDYTREENYVEIKSTIPESYEEAERQAREGVKKATREHTLDDFYNNMMEFGLTRGISPRDTQFKGLENNLDNYILINNPESKKTHLRIIPKEVLDSLAYHHGLNPGVPMEVVYGLPEREDEFGGLNLMNIKDRDSLAVLPPFYMFDAWDYMTSPEEDILLAAKRKALGRPVARDELLTEKQEQQVQDIIADTYRRDKKTYDKNPLYNPNMNIYDWAWEWYRQGRYNPGDPDYLNKVTKDGTDIISSPAFKQWWEKEGKYYYLKGKDEEPKGHKRAYNSNAFGGPVFLIANKQFM